MRTIYQTNVIDGRQAKVYHDYSVNEFIVRFYNDGTEIADASYHTGDKEDAIDTAELAISKPEITTKPRFTFEKDAILMVDCHHGIYIPQLFAKALNPDHIISGANDYDWAALEAGPENPNYWDTWNYLQDNLKVIDPDTQVVYMIWNDDDCYLVPEGCEIPE